MKNNRSFNAEDAKNAQIKTINIFRTINIIYL
jgi:hypothetical protein